MKNKPLFDKDHKDIEGVSVLNMYYQRNCNVIVPIIYFLICTSILFVHKFVSIEFEWFINLGFLFLFILSAICFLESIVKLFEFTKFWEVQISEEALAFQILETYQVIEQRGNIFTLIRRTEDMTFSQKFLEKFIKPNRKFKLHKKQSNKQ